MIKWVLFIYITFSLDVTAFGQSTRSMDANSSFILNNNLNMPARNRTPGGNEIKKIYTNGDFSTNLSASTNVSIFKYN